MDKASKQAIDMPGMATTRLPYTDYYTKLSGGLETHNCEESGKLVIANYTTSNHGLKNGSCSFVGSLRFS